MIKSRRIHTEIKISILYIMEAKLKELYEDPEIGLSSKDKFYKRVKQIIPHITLKEVDEFLKKQAVTQIIKPVNTKARTYNTIISLGVRNNYQIDIFILPYPNQNKKYKYLLTCIDVYSRFADVEPLHNKTGNSVLEAFKTIIQRMGVCKNLNCDEGSEFIYTPFQRYCKDNDIHVWMSDPEQENKNSIIERWHRTLRNMILKYCLVKGKGYIDDLRKLIHNYNNNEHSTIGNIKPIDIWEGRQEPHQDIHKIEMKFKVGDRVRHVVKKSSFDKASSTTTYTIKIYTISRIEKNSIYLDELKKPYRDYELVLAVENNNDKASEFNKKIIEDQRQEKIQRMIKRSGI